MGNNLAANPIFVDTTDATLWSGTKNVRLIQWIDDNADIVHDSSVVFLINGVTLTAKIQPVNDQLGFGAVAWQIGPFNPGIPMTDVGVTITSAGHVHIWVD